MKKNYYVTHENYNNMIHEVSKKFADLVIDFADYMNDNYAEDEIEIVEIFNQFVNIIYYDEAAEWVESFYSCTVQGILDMAKEVTDYYGDCFNYYNSCEIVTLYILKEFEIYGAINCKEVED